MNTSPFHHPPLLLDLGGYFAGEQIGIMNNQKAWRWGELWFKVYPRKRNGGENLDRRISANEDCSKDSMDIGDRLSSFIHDMVCPRFNGFFQ